MKGHGWRSVSSLTATRCDKCRACEVRTLNGWDIWVCAAFQVVHRVIRRDPTIPHMLQLACRSQPTLGYAELGAACNRESDEPLNRMDEYSF